MGGLRISIYALLLLGAIGAIAALLYTRLGSTADVADNDARLVYCMEPSHRDDLIDAAITLGVAQSGSLSGEVRVGSRQMTTANWRKARRAGFDRACDAITAASIPATQDSSSQDSALKSLLDILLPVAAGALLTLAIDDLHTASDRGWAKADELRSSWRSFARSVTDYIQNRLKASQYGVPASRAVDERRNDLAANLRDIYARHRRSGRIKGLRDQIDEGTLGYHMALDWAIGDDEQSKASRENRAAGIRTALEEAEISLEKVAHAMEHLIWPFWKL